MLEAREIEVGIGQPLGQTIRTVARSAQVEGVSAHAVDAHVVPEDAAA